MITHRDIDHSEDADLIALSNFLLFVLTFVVAPADRAHRLRLSEKVNVRIVLLNHAGRLSINIKASVH